MTGTEKRLSPDAICEKYARSRTKTRILVRELDDHTILVEAPAHGLKFLAELLAAQAEFTDCGFDLGGPRGPGSRFFDGSSERGLYIHRLPCQDHGRPE